MNLIHYEAVTHASCGSSKAEDLSLKCIRYCKFKRKIKLSQIKIFPVQIRYTPIVVGQPEHILIQTYQPATGDWETVRDVHLPEYVNPEPHEIMMSDIETDFIRIICDSEHRVEMSHGEWWAYPTVIPFKILDRVEVNGQESEPIKEPVYNAPLQRKEIHPADIENVEIDVKNHEISYKSRFFRVVFSLKRPIIKEMSYDCTGKGKTDVNLICAESVWNNEKKANGISGPKLVDRINNFSAQNFTGEVVVSDDYILYKNVKATEDFTMDIKFIIQEKGMKIYIQKKCHRQYQAIEAEDFSFVFDAKKAITGVQGVPQTDCERVGIVKLPALISSPGFGSLEMNPLTTGDLYIQTDSFRDQQKTWFSPLVGGSRDEFGYITFEPGHYTAEFELVLGGVLPKLKEGIDEDAVPDALKRGWSAAFAFRPEFAGFSNNALSGNCHLSQYHIAELVPYTKPAKNGTDMTELLRFTVEYALRNGPGYGDNRELYLDSDPSVLISAARVYQLQREDAWIKKLWKNIRATILRILSNIDEKGLVKCETLTGNSGSKRWSCNGWDVISFGNYDAYSNVLAYRALKNAETMCDIVQDTELKRLCTKAHAGIKENFEKTFLSPENGTISGWVSADGKHHDYLFTHINSMAICFGLVEKDNAKKIMKKLMDELNKMGLDYFYYGLPVNLISIRNEDAPTGSDYLREDGRDQFGTYINGSLTTLWTNYFIRALELCDMEHEADMICKDLMRSFEAKTLYGGFHSGTEFFTWQGQPCGYEGVLVGQFPVLTSLAIRCGLVERLEQEWWL